jgi:hypothetical protein
MTWVEIEDLAESMAYLDIIEPDDVRYEEEHNLNQSVEASILAVAADVDLER